jgi:hypothetical protein
LAVAQADVQSDKRPTNRQAPTKTERRRCKGYDVLASKNYHGGRVMTGTVLRIIIGIFKARAKPVFTDLPDPPFCQFRRLVLPPAPSVCFVDSLVATMYAPAISGFVGMRAGASRSPALQQQ